MNTEQIICTGCGQMRTWLGSQCLSSCPCLEKSKTVQAPQASQADMSEFAKAQINVRMLKEWLAILPPEMDDAPIEAVVGSVPFALKRIVAYRGKYDGWMGVVVNPLATHLSDEFYAENERISTLSLPPLPALCPKCGHGAYIIAGETQHRCP